MQDIEIKNPESKFAKTALILMSIVVVISIFFVVLLGFQMRIL